MYCVLLLVGSTEELLTPEDSSSRTGSNCKYSSKVTHEWIVQYAKTWMYLNDDVGTTHCRMFPSKKLILHINKYQLKTLQVVIWNWKIIS